MTPDEWRRVKAILEGVLDQPAEARESFIVSACAGDATLRARVTALAAAAEGDGGMLDAPNAVEAGAEVPEAPSRAGERVGPYELLAEIGRGGMGTVHLARRADDEFEQRVAIKLMRPGFASDLDLKRFKSERQIAAVLDHPNIARLLDGGATAEGAPYFVMEHVEGGPLLDYCRERGLSVRQRLILFRQICGAVQYAHQNLVVHRDLKPGNILVTAEGEPKLLDFGIAKLLSGGGGTEFSEPTATLDRLLTPEYASPEQVRGRPVTTASDIYSLGVILYELLAGEKPYRIETGDPAELVRLVCERDPERPSTRTAGLSRDVDAIVLKAMRKEPERRYPSAAALSDDIGRFLDGRPVEARRPSAAYRTKKFVRRHRIGVAATVLVLAALAGGVLATLREARRARAAEARAERRFNEDRKMANSFLFEFHDAIRDLPGSTPARALVVKRALEYLDQLAKESAGDRELRRELAEAYQKVGDVQGNPFMQNLGDLKGAVASYGKAIALLEPAVAGPGASDAERASLATAYLMGGALRLAEGNAQEALAMARKGLALRQALAAEAPGDSARQMDLSQAWQYVAFDAAPAGKHTLAAEALAAQAAILEEQRRLRPTDRAVRRSLGQNLFLRGEAVRREGDLAAALARFREAVRIEEELVNEEPRSVQLRRDLAYSLTEAGNTEVDLGNTTAALEDYRRTLAVFEAMSKEDPKSTDPILGIAMSHHNLGEALEKLGRRAEALQEYRLARPAYEAVVAMSPSGAWAAGMLATLYVKTADSQYSEDRASACELYGKAVGVFESFDGLNMRPDLREYLLRARDRLAACRNRS
jgi:non-specific serine/threonine protein kinase/serine/threonine-protein kinase